MRRSVMRRSVRLQATAVALAVGLAGAVWPAPSPSAHAAVDRPVPSG